MTTHFTSGVTNVTSTGSGGKLKLPDPIKFHIYFIYYTNFKKIKCRRV